MSDYYSIRWMDGVVCILDQRYIPEQVLYRNYTRCSDVAFAIQDMVIRGAPAIGVAAAYALALVAWHTTASNSSAFLRELNLAAEELRKSRPTAVNLFVAIHQIMKITKDAGGDNLDQLKHRIVAEALDIAREDAQLCLKIAQNGQAFLPQKANVLHHCNTGALATAGIGTALGVIRVAHESGKKIHVFVDETRPRLQGARLTVWELQQLGIPYTLIVDSASGYMMKHHKIDSCLVGCDRIAANGDVANKIGTYNLALVAFAHGVPFYSVGPTSTIDLTIAQGDKIPIEERAESEITRVGDTHITPEGVNVANPAFDVTPAKYITAIITDRGVARPPYEDSLQKLLLG